MSAYQAVLAGCAALTMTFTTGIPVAGAHEAPVTIDGANGQQLTVSSTDHLSGKGQTVQVSGTAYNIGKGIYVAFCVRPAAGKIPTPCGGGAATTGGESSAWISSNPPSYGKSLAKPFGDGGSFSVTLQINAQLNPTTDCRKVECAIVTRADHTRSDDRSQDVIVPVAFKADSPLTTPLLVGGSAGAAVLVVLAGVGGWLLRRNRRPPRAEMAAETSGSSA